jgi:hypothetical protein
MGVIFGHKFAKKDTLKKDYIFIDYDLIDSPEDLTFPSCIPHVVLASNPIAGALLSPHTNGVLVALLMAS